VRLDPGQTAGEIRISAMKLLDANDRPAYEWRFLPPGPDPQPRIDP